MHWRVDSTCDQQGVGVRGESKVTPAAPEDHRVTLASLYCSYWSTGPSPPLRARALWSFVRWLVCPDAYVALGCYPAEKQPKDGTENHGGNWNPATTRGRTGQEGLEKLAGL